MSYIPLIKTVKWIDLSDEHKKLRETVQNDIRSACTENGNVQPIMLKGAFGIGKSTTLYYLFHYGWEILKAPTFYLPLSKIVEKVKEEALKSDSGKVENNQLGRIISNMINIQIEALGRGNWDDIYELDFPEFKSKDEETRLCLSEYLKDFQPVMLDSADEVTSGLFKESVFSESVIKEAIASRNTPLLLIDEFESKFYELKRIVESSGGGILRELFDEIVQTKPFMLVIGNGPASGYEVAKEKGTTGGNDSETAANRRLKTIPIPFPTVDLLKRKFMKDSPNGFANFIWWMSRCRPGHIQKLCDAIDYDTYRLYNFSDFITKEVFNEPIDESGEEVKYLKVGYFNSINSYILPILKDLLLDFEPHVVSLEETYKDSLRDPDNACNFYCNDELVNVEKELLPAIKDDICKYLEKCNSEGKYTSVSYIRNLNKYFSYILSACSNSDGEMVFNTPCKDEEDALASTFLIPILELTYDFISQYEDGDDAVIKETKDFILDCTKHIERSIKDGSIAEDFPTLNDMFSGFKIVKIKTGSDLFMQFSLRAVREIIEQPIGSPKLKYKDMSLETKLCDAIISQGALLCNNKADNKVIFIPILEGEQLEEYILAIKKYLSGQISDLHKDGKRTLRFVYLQDNEIINSLIKDATCVNNELLPVAKYKKLVFKNYQDYQFNFGGQIADYIDSLAKIAISGCSCGDISDVSDDNTIDIPTIIGIIKDREWTRQKEAVRTIEHYEKLLCEGENSVLRRIEASSSNDYSIALEDAICEKTDYTYNVCDFTAAVDASVTDDKSKFLGLYYLMERSGKDQEINQTLLNILESIGVHSSARFLEPKQDPIIKDLHFDQILKIVSSPEASKLIGTYDANDKFVSRLTTFADCMKTEAVGRSVADVLSFVQNSLASHWIVSYNEQMSYYGFSAGELLIKLLYLKNYINDIDFTVIRTQLSSRLLEKEKELTDAKTKIGESIQQITDILYSQKYAKEHPENMPFPGYISELSGVSKLLIQCKRLLAEDNGSISVLCMVWSITWRIADIVTAATLFSRQISGVYTSLLQKKNLIEKEYQTPINTIYSDALTAKLISLSESKIPGRPTKYDGSYCWDQFTRFHLTTKPEAQAIFDAKLNPSKEITLKQEDIQKFNEYLQTTVVSINSNYRQKMSEALANCKKCQQDAQQYNTLYDFVNNLLSFDEQ